MKRKISIILALVISVLCASLFAACSIDFRALLGLSKPHTHNYSSDWKSDTVYHWRECQNSGCDEKESDKDQHYDFDGDGDCDVCLRSMDGHIHNYQWVDNRDGTHKKHCDVTGCSKPDILEGKHSYNEDDKCECGAVKPLHEHDYRWLNNGDGTHRKHCGVVGCDNPDLIVEEHEYDEEGKCVCGAVKPVEGHEHLLTLVPAIDATCTQEGNRAYYTCSGCDKLFFDEEALTPATMDNIIIKAIDHTFKDYVSDKNATCVKNGTETALCSMCHTAKHTREEENSALGHDPITHDGKPVSCFEKGWNTYVTCSRCDYTTYEEIPAIGHHTMQNGSCSVCGAIDWEYEGLNLIELTSSSYGFEQLGKMKNGTNKQVLYELIDEKAKELHNDESFDYKADMAFALIDFGGLNITTGEAVSVWKTYLDDHPLFYWFSNTVGSINTSLGLYVAEEYIAGAVRARTNKMLYKKLQEYMRYASDETSAYQIALAYHDKIIGAIDYAYDNKGAPEEARWAHSIVGVFEERGAVCEGYARSFQLLLNLRGIENVIVEGEAGGGGHAWNLIKLDDGQWYWCDLTWDDAPNYTWGMTYRYFCVNDWQGVDWNDGAEQTGKETGQGIGGSPAGCVTFVSEHVAYTSEGSGINFLYDLPARSKHVYAAMNGELLVRDSFQVGNVKYAVTGYHTAQVTALEGSGAVTINDSVQYLETRYTIISIGVVGGTKLFGAGYVFSDNVTSVTIPSTVIFFWSWIFYNCSSCEIYYNGTVEQWDKIGKLSYWKNVNKPMVVHCNGKDITV